MISYLTGVDTARARTSGRVDLAVLGTPDSRAERSWRAYGWWAADNGCFAEALGRPWSDVRWLAWLAERAQDRRMLHACAWATVPDRVGDHAGTVERWARYVGAVAELGYVPAFVAQDGCTPSTIPGDAGAVFIGGTDAYKCSDVARAVIDEAHARGLAAHVGRVNTAGRFAWCARAGADTCDGTMLRFGAETWRRLVRWLDRENAPRLALDVEGAA